jgi:hypothetical protein
MLQLSLERAAEDVGSTSLVGDLRRDLDLLAVHDALAAADQAVADGLDDIERVELGLPGAR